MVKNTLCIAFVIFSNLLSYSVLALDCKPLEPRGGEQSDTRFEGRVEGAVDGLFAKIAGVNLDIEGAYRDIQQDVLKEYPDADRLYIWERLIYLQCQLLNESGLTNQAKIEQFNTLMDKLVTGPPRESGASFNTLEEVDRTAQIQSTIDRIGQGVPESTLAQAMHFVKLGDFNSRVARDGKVSSTYRKEIDGTEYRTAIRYESVNESGHTCRHLVTTNSKDDHRQQTNATWCRTSGVWVREEMLGDHSEARQSADKPATSLQRAIEAKRSKNYPEALRLYRALAERGDVVAQNNLAVMYNNGEGVPNDPVKAADLYRQAADQGYDMAQKNLGYMYEEGLGVPKSHVEAVRWYRRSAEQGLALGQVQLGRMYEHGRGVEQDDVEAANWYRKAAEQGNAAGQAHLGYMYQLGKGVPQNRSQALSWYREAAQQGDDWANSQLLKLGAPLPQ